MSEARKIARVLAPAALLVAALVLSIAPLKAAAPEAPKTLELGKGPTIVILHDLGGSRMTWLPTVRKLIGTHHVVLVDLPGHGDSPLPDPFTLDAAAEALDQVLAKQDPDSTVLVGKGMGGMLSLLALKAHPDRVRGLAVIDAGLKSPIPVDDQMIKYFRERLDERYDAILKSLYTSLGRDSVQGVSIHALAAQTPSQTMKSYIVASLRSDGTPALKSLKVPFLFIATDRLLKDKDWETVGKEIGYEDPAAIQVRHMAGAGYMVMQDQPDSLASALSEFTAGVLAKKK